MSKWTSIMVRVLELLIFESVVFSLIPLRSFSQRCAISAVIMLVYCLSTGDLEFAPLLCMKLLSRHLETLNVLYFPIFSESYRHCLVRLYYLESVLYTMVLKTVTERERVHSFRQATPYSPERPYIHLGLRTWCHNDPSTG